MLTPVKISEFFHLISFICQQCYTSEHMSIHTTCLLNLYIDIDIDIYLCLQEMRNGKPQFSFLVLRYHFLFWNVMHMYVLVIATSFQRSREHSKDILQFIKISQLVQLTNFSSRSSRQLNNTDNSGFMYLYVFKNTSF